MSINVIIGAPGRGKTTYLAYLARKFQKKGLKVYSNVYIKGCLVCDVHSDLNFYEMTDGVLLMDEGQSEFDNRNWKSMSDQTKRFFQLHRHYNLDVYVSCQNYEDLDAKIKRLVDKIFVMKKALFYPYVLMIKAIKQDVDISADNSSIISIYKWKFLGTRYHFAPYLWKYFDSYYRDILNKKDWIEWNEENVKLYIKDFTVNKDN